jgi:hypothetical protein
VAHALEGEHSMSSALVTTLSNRLGGVTRPRRRSNLANGNESLLKSYKLQKGLYARVAKSLCVDASYVSRVASGERHSDRVKCAILRELSRASAPHGSHPQCPICHDSQLTVLDTKLKIPVSGTRTKNGHGKDMAAYRCTEQHIFMIRNADLQAPKRRQQAAA